MNKLLLTSLLAVVTGTQACRPRPESSLSSATPTSTAAAPSGPCGDKPVLVVTSSAGEITLMGGTKYPTGYFLRELTDPVIALAKAGCQIVVATPGGVSPVLDSNSLELLWAYYPYPDLKAEAKTNRAEAIKIAQSLYGKVRFSVETETFKRISPEVQAFVAEVKAAQDATGLLEKAPRSLEDVAEELSHAEASPYAGLMVPGGHVPMEDLKVSPAMGKVLNYFHGKNLPTALVCHAPVALIATTQVGPMTYAGYKVAVADRVAEQMLEQMGPLQGYRVQSYVDDDLAAAGVALRQNPWPGYPQVVGDRELLTGQNPASAPFLGEMLVESLELSRSGKADWWSGRKVHVVNEEILLEQQKATEEVKKVVKAGIAVNTSTKWKQSLIRRFFGGNASDPTNIFLSNGYLSAFDQAMTFSEQASSRGLYPAEGTPRTELHRFKLPLVSFQPSLDIFQVVKPLHNYYLPWINDFYGKDACDNYRPGEGIDPAAWLVAQPQATLRKVFACAKAPEVIPTGFGRGVGSIYGGVTGWNELQKKVGGAVWGGKIFTTQEGKTTLVNVMNETGRNRYNANVYLTDSTLDGKPTIVLDYRIDASAGDSSPQGISEPLVDKIIHGIRDEIREVSPGVYVGRANLYKGFLTSLEDPSLSDGEFESPANWFMAANFFLDFRP